MDAKTTLLDAIKQLSRNPAITDTLWMPEGYGSVTVVEALAEIASDLGASESELDDAIGWDLTKR